MKIVTTLRASFFVALATLIGSAPTSALNRIDDYYGMNPSSEWVIQSQRDVRLGFGQLLYDMFGSTSGAFAHIAVTPSTGLFVQVGPSATNTLGSVYQFRPDDTTVYGSGATQLSADPTQVFTQGLLSTPPIALGPFTAPASSGQSILDLVECQVQTVDATPQTEIFETAPNTSVSQTANRDRNDIVACQIKTGTATNAAPTAPTADASWVAIATVFVAYGQTTLAPSNVTLSVATQFYNFVPFGPNSSINVNAINGTSVNTSGNVNAASATIRDSVSAGTGNFGSLATTALTSSGVVTGTSANIQNLLTAGSLNVGPISTTSLTDSGSLTSATLNVGGQSSLGLVTAGATSLSSVNVGGQANFGTVNEGATSVTSLNSSGTVAATALNVQGTSALGAVNASAVSATSLNTSGNVNGQTGTYSGSVTAQQFVTASARSLKTDIHPMLVNPLSIVRTIHPTWWRYRAHPGMKPELGVIADNTASELSGPNHDHLDIGATAVVAAAAAHEVDEHEQVLQKQVDALADRSGVSTKPVASQTALDALATQVSTLQGEVVFAFLLLAGFFVAILWLAASVRSLKKRTA